MKKKLLIDCDPGIDDALALFMALASDELDVQGITTVSGNTGVEQVTRNALALMSWAGKKVPVSQGASQPLVVPPEEGGEAVHGKNGLGNVLLPPGEQKKDPRPAEQLLFHLAEEARGELEVAALGPLTNLAAALAAYPGLKTRIRRIHLMGGSAGRGNVTPEAEFNIYADPHAAAVVFQSGIPLDMYGLDVTNRAVLLENEWEELESDGGPIPRICWEMMDFYKGFYESHGFQTPALHDPFALACVIQENLAKKKECYVEVETEGPSRGRTVVDLQGQTGNPPNVRVALELNRPGFSKLLLTLLRSY